MPKLWRLFPAKVSLNRCWICRAEKLVILGRARLKSHCSPADFGINLGLTRLSGQAVVEHPHTDTVRNHVELHNFRTNARRSRCHRQPNLQSQTKRASGDTTATSTTLWHMLGFRLHRYLHSSLCLGPLWPLFRGHADVSVRLFLPNPAASPP